jgi:hypothetical protein
MKKVFLLLLLSIYTFSTFGIGVREFYCCGKLRSIHFSFIQESKENSAKGENAANKCCKTTHKFFKVKDNHKAADNLSDMSLPFVYLQNIASIFTTPVYFKGQPTVANGTHAPPPGTVIPIYLSNRVFRI